MKNVSFFLSSTFNDMQSERDLIREHIAPEIEELVKKYGYNSEFIDLRWGIDTDKLVESDASNKILNTCFDEIKKSRPFFIALLGERYGWIPDESDVLFAVDENGFDIGGNAERSVTELEIECAIKSFPYLDRCLFYFRDPVDYGDDEVAKRNFVSVGREKEKIDALRKRLTELFPGRVKSYSARWNKDKQIIDGLDGFRESILTNLREAVSEEFAAVEKPKDEISESINIQDSFIEERVATFSGREADLSYFDKFVSGDKQVLVVKGNSGSGKSSLLTKFITISRGTWCVIPFFVGVDERSFTVENMLRAVIYRAYEALGQPVPPLDLASEELLKQYYNTLNTLALSKKVVLVVDAVNQFERTNLEDKIKWLNLYSLSKGVKVIVSTTTDYYQMKYFEAMGAEIYDLDYLRDDDIVAVVKQFFAANHKELNPKILDGILCKGGDVRPCREPIYLLTLLEELNCLSKEDFKKIKLRESELHEAPGEAIINYLYEMVTIAPLSREELFEKFYNENCEKLGEENCAVFVAAIALSRRGLNERLMERLFGALDMKYEAAIFSYFRKLFKGHLSRNENGFYDFGHAVIKSYFARRFDEEFRSKIVSAMISCLKTEDDENEFKKREFAYYLNLGGRMGEFTEYFHRLSGDEAVDASLVSELQKGGCLDEMLYPVSEMTESVWEFVERTVKSGVCEFPLSEQYAIETLNCIYSLEYRSDKRLLRHVFEVYNSLGLAAEKAGRYAQAKDYLSMALAVDKKTELNMDRYSPYFHIAACCHKLGNTLQYNKYRRLSEGELEKRYTVDKSAAKLLLDAYYDNCINALDAVFVNRKRIELYISKIRSVISESGGYKTYPQWASKIVFSAATIKTSDDFESEISACKELLETAESDLIKAETAYNLAVFYSSRDLKLSREYACIAYGHIKESIKADNGTPSLELMDKICKLRSTFCNIEKSDLSEISGETCDVNGRLLLTEPSYKTAQRYIQLDAVNKPLLQDAKLIRKRLSRSERTANQKAVNKILSLIIVGVALIFLIVMPLLVSVFRGVMRRFTDEPLFELYFTLFVTGASETVLNLIMCFLGYGLLQISRPTSDYLERRLWEKRCVILAVSFVVLLSVYIVLWQYLYAVFLLQYDFLSYELPYICLLISGFLLIMLLIHSVMSFISHERRVSSMTEMYERFVLGGKKNVLSTLVDLAFLGVTSAIYFTAAACFPYTSLTMTTAPVLVLPKLWFVIAVSALALIMLAKLIRLIVLWIYGKKHYEKTL